MGCVMDVNFSWSQNAVLTYGDVDYDMASASEIYKLDIDWRRRIAGVYVAIYRSISSDASQEEKSQGYVRFVFEFSGLEDLTMRFLPPYPGGGVGWYISQFGFWPASYTPPEGQAFVEPYQPFTPAAAKKLGRCGFIFQGYVGEGVFLVADKCVLRALTEDL